LHFDFIKITPHARGVAPPFLLFKHLAVGNPAIVADRNRKRIDNIVPFKAKIFKIRTEHLKEFIQEPADFVQPPVKATLLKHIGIKPYCFINLLLRSGCRRNLLMKQWR